MPHGLFCDIGAYELVGQVPTLSEWAQLMMLALLLGGGLFGLRSFGKPQDRLRSGCALSLSKWQACFDSAQHRLRRREAA